MTKSSSGFASLGYVATMNLKIWVNILVTQLRGLGDMDNVAILPSKFSGFRWFNGYILLMPFE
jgi:hypothetical protein